MGTEGTEPGEGGREEQSLVDARYAWLDLVDDGPDPDSPPWTEETGEEFRRMTEDLPPGDHID